MSAYFGVGYMSPKIPLTLSFAKAANFLGVVGIVGSLIFVGLELRQNQKLAKTNAYQTRLSEMQESQRNLALSNDLAAIMVKRKLKGADALTKAELLRARAWATGVQWRMESQYYQYRQGFLDAVAINRTLDDIVTQDLYEEWRDLGLLERLYPEEWKQMVQHRVEQAAKERASGDSE